MKKIILFFIVLISIKTQAQCFQITSILVDGCDGGNEGKNEMVTFSVGSSSLSVSTLTVSWPANPWRGICTTVGTTTAVAFINSTILGCGYLKEPTAGVLPANSKVLLITSTDFNPTASSFVGLSDTLYVIFQCAGNIGGHFANYTSVTTPSVALRTLTMTFGVGCSDVVTYNRNNLLKMDLTIGAEDGGAVEFDAAGTATYVNRGCTAPYIPLSVDAGANKTVCYNSAVTLTATTGGSYSWVNWSLGSGATGTFSPTFSLVTTYTPGSSDADIIKLYCTIFKLCGTSTLTAKDSVNVTVLKLPIPIISATSNSICSGATSVLSYSVTNASSSGTTTPLWNPGGLTTPTYTVSSAGVYSLQASNACGSANTSYTISSIPNPSITISPAGTFSFCTGSSMTFTAASTVGNYLWQSGETTSTLTATTSQTAVVTTSNSCGTASASVIINVIPLPTLTVTPSTISICVGSSAIASAIANTSVTYNWSTGATTSTVNLTMGGVFTVTVTNTCGNAVGNVTVTSGASPSITAIASNTLLCPAQTATLSYLGSTGSTIWSNGATTSTTSTNMGGVYTVTVTNTCGTAISSVTLVTGVTPTISISPTTATLCPTQTIAIVATSNVSSFLWNTGATTNSIIASTSGIKTVTVTNGCGTATGSINIIANTLPVLNLTASNYTICGGQISTLTVTGGNVPYAWSNSTSTGSVVSTTGGTVSVSNTNICGTVTQTINVVVINVNANFSATPVTGVKPLVVNFLNNTTGATSYVWDFGNGATAITQTVTAQTYTAGGTYTVYLTASNGTCTDTYSLTIVVLDEEPYIIIPNVFTPNGDNSNEIFKVSSSNISEFNCTIFNRWGLKIYEWNDIKTGWDGRIDSKDAVDGIYFYIIKAKDINQKDINKQGSFSLLR